MLVDVFRSMHLEGMVGPREMDDAALTIFQIFQKSQFYTIYVTELKQIELI